MSAVITGGIAVVLYRYAKFSIVDPAYASPWVSVLLNVILFGLCWWLTAFLLNKFPVYKILAVLGLLVVAILAERYITVQNNPITIPAIILFWIGVAYLTMTEFVWKYRILILFVFGLVLSYYFFLFLTAPNNSVDHRLDFANVMLFPIPVFAALWGYEQWRWLTNLKSDKAKAELMLLKSQINPHFFFNTLNNLYGLVVEKSDQAPEVVLKLSDMMRYTIYEGKEDVVLLRDEIIYLENYIELHKIRYQQKVDIRFTHRLAQDYKIAPLLFIILLENAFKHGVERMREGAYVQLHLTAEHNQVTFEIENNFKPKPTVEPRGIGVENLRKRLEHIYPNRHQFNVEQQASIYKVQLTIEL
ncbi:MAG: sensor histidine kinase [Saprospiraceae bacterium]|nr:sensor histidine kinase [Saprospiraceae bacterium]